MEKTNEQIAMRVSLYTIAVNIALTAFKLFAGIYGRSAAMLADAAESVADLFSTVIVMVGVKLANQKPDKEHPYGHERFECAAAIILSALLFITGIGIGWAGIQKITAAAGDGKIEMPGFIALVAAIATIVIKEAMYWYTRMAAKKINSGALMANAWHHRSDAFSSIGSFIGILGARLGFPILDPITAVVICLFILRVSISIFRESIGKMTDKSCDEKTESEIRGVILAQNSVVGIDLLKTRLFGDKIYVDVEISVDGSNTLQEAHNIGDTVHNSIESEFSNIKHCTVHINPAIFTGVEK